MAISKRMMGFLPCLLWTGLSIAMYEGLFIPFFIDMMPNLSAHEQFRNALFAMAGLGLGEIIGGFVIAKFIESRGMRFGAILQAILVTIVFIVFFVANEVREFGGLCYALTILWGAMDSAQNAITNSILGFEFESNLTPFAVRQSYTAIFVFLVLLLESEINGKTAFRVWLSFCYIFGLLANVAVYLFKFKKPFERRLIVNESFA